jgi:hypothetical protein
LTGWQYHDDGNPQYCADGEDHSEDAADHC